jgi:hypothetical protein
VALGVVKIAVVTIGTTSSRARSHGPRFTIAANAMLRQAPRGGQSWYDLAQRRRFGVLLWGA